MKTPHLSVFTGKPTTAHPLDVTCVRCGRVSRGKTRAEAENQVAESNSWIDSLPADEQLRHTRSSLDMYRCLGCGGTRFRPAQDGDCPDGVTLSPVIYEPKFVIHFLKSWKVNDKGGKGVYRHRLPPKQRNTAGTNGHQIRKRPIKINHL